jgi:hypothetical protein
MQKAVGIVDEGAGAGVDRFDEASWRRLSATVRMRITLWRHADGHRCHWCGRPTVLVTRLDGAAMPDEGATIDHLYPRGDPRRGRDDGHAKLQVGGQSGLG